MSLFANIGRWPAILTAIAAGGIIHISATLMMPQFTAASSVTKLAAQLPANRMRVMPPSTANNQVLPFMGPDTRVAVCRYDVADGPIKVTAVLPDKGWTVSLYTLQGDNFYILPAQDFRRLEVAFQLIPQSDRFLWIFNVGRSIETNASQVAVPQTQGLIVVRAPLNGRAFQSEAEAVLSRAQCVLNRS